MKKQSDPGQVFTMMKVCICNSKRRQVRKVLCIVNKDKSMTFASENIEHEEN